MLRLNQTRRGPSRGTRRSDTGPPSSGSPLESQHLTPRCPLATSEDTGQGQGAGLLDQNPRDPAQEVFPETAGMGQPLPLDAPPPAALGSLHLRRQLSLEYKRRPVHKQSLRE